MLEELLRRADVNEELVLGSRFGFMAFHGGSLERATEVVARSAAAAAGASYYGVVQHAEEPVHVASTLIQPTASAALASFFAHVEVVITVHGYGREDRMRDVLLGGRNRTLAQQVASIGRERLPDYTFHADLDEIPRELAGQHPENPVNRPRRCGVQIELPALLRWHVAEGGWSDCEPVGRAPQLDALIGALADVASSWQPR
ncbi:MAG: poly-gamma-glutamate hydrolase family protein [Acidimicrobiales bacterium]|nr:poly-gamma-glutamate hydrolase family protein [Acidimicrobiales bacterium]